MEALALTQRKCFHRYPDSALRLLYTVDKQVVLGLRTMRAISHTACITMTHTAHHLSDTLDSIASQRRRALRWLAAGATLPVGLWACGGGSDDSADTSSTSAGSTTTSATTGATTTTATTTPGSCVAQPAETAGPYPADGSQASNARLNVLTTSGIVRQDIRTSLGTGTTAAGIPLTITLQLANTRQACAALAGYAVYLWHCTREGTYSLYSAGITGENFLRGVQQADANGVLTFTTIVPGCYDGRYPHMHFEVYPSLAAATTASNAVLTSQLTFPADMLAEVYATNEYATSRSNYARISLASDNVFGNDQGVTQISTATGAVATGYNAHLVVGLAA